MPDRKPILPSSAVWFYPLRQLHLRPGIEGDPFSQTLYPGQTRRIIYRDYINYPLLDLLNREYMDDPSFFFLLLPTILAASFPGTYSVLFSFTAT